MDTTRYLFEIPRDQNEKIAVFKNCFDIIYDEGNFLEYIDLIVRKKMNVHSEGAHCIFPDMDDYDDELHFEGVMFIFGDYAPEEKLIVSEQECFKLIQMACERYIARHPEDTEKVQEILAQSLLAK